MIEVQNCCHQYGHIKFQIQMSEQQMSPELYTYNHQIDLNMSGASSNWWYDTRIQCYQQYCSWRPSWCQAKIYLGQESVS